MTLKLGIPAYVYPTGASTWATYTSTASVNEFIIANDSNGDMTVVDPNYTVAINAAKASGNRVLGYVHTTWGARPLSTVQARIDAWFALYPNIDGIFFDEGSTDCGSVSYYQTLVSYVHSKGGTYTVLNPGTAAPSCYNGVADAICTFEGPQSSYSSFTPQSWEATATSKIWHIIHTSSSCSLNSVEGLISSAESKGADILFVTSAGFEIISPCWSALATLVIPQTTALTVSVSFSTATVVVGSSTVETITVHNPTNQPITGVTISQVTPSGISGLSGSSWSGPLNGVTVPANGSYSVSSSLSADVAAVFNFTATARTSTSPVFSGSASLTSISYGTCSSSTFDWLGRPCCGPGSGLYQSVPARGAVSQNIFQGTFGEGVYPNSYTDASPVSASTFNGLVLGASGCFNAGWLLVDLFVTYIDSNNITHTNYNLYHGCPYPTCTGGFICGPMAMPALPPDAVVVTGWTMNSQYTFGVNGGAIISYYTMPASNAVPGPHNGVDVSCASAPNPGSTDVDVVLTKTAFNASVRPGQTAVYDVKVTNIGPAAANGVTITDLIPADVSARSWLVEPSSTGTFSGGSSGSGNLSGTVDVPGSGGFVWFVVSDVVSPSVTASNVGSTVSVVLPNGMHDINGANNIPVSAFTPIDYVVPTVVPDLTNRCVQNSVDPGGPITFILTVDNPTPFSITSFLTDFMPSTLTSWSWTSSVVAGQVSGATASGVGAITDHLILNAGGKVVYTINGVVRTSGLGSDLQSDAQSVWTINGVQTVTIATGVAHVNTPPPQIGSPIVTKVADLPSVAPGDTITWYVNVQNNHNFTLNNVQVQDAIPVGLSSWSYTASGAGGASGFSSTGSTGINDNLSLPAGATVQYVVRGTVLRTGFPSQIVNSVSYTNNDGTLHTPLTSAVTVGGTVCFAMNKTVDKIVVTAGEVLTYILTVENNLDYVIPGVNILDPLPSNVASRTYSVVAQNVTGVPSIGSGGINHVANFGSMGRLVYTITDTVSLNASGTTCNAASIVLPEGFVSA